MRCHQWWSNIIEWRLQAGWWKAIVLFSILPPSPLPLSSSFQDAIFSMLFLKCHVLVWSISPCFTPPHPRFLIPILHPNVLLRCLVSFIFKGKRALSQGCQLSYPFMTGNVVSCDMPESLMHFPVLMWFFFVFYMIQGFKADIGYWYWNMSWIKYDF